MFVNELSINTCSPRLLKKDYFGGGWGRMWWFPIPVLCGDWEESWLSRGLGAGLASHVCGHSPCMGCEESGWFWQRACQQLLGRSGKVCGNRSASISPQSWRRELSKEQKAHRRGLHWCRSWPTQGVRGDRLNASFSADVASSLCTEEAPEAWFQWRGSLGIQKHPTFSPVLPSPQYGPWESNDIWGAGTVKKPKAHMPLCCGHPPEVQINARNLELPLTKTIYNLIGVITTIYSFWSKLSQEQ